MNPPHHNWPQQVRSLTAEQMRQLAGGIAAQLSQPNLSIQDLMYLQWHYYQAAFAYALLHAGEIREVIIQPRSNYFFRLFPKGSHRGFSPQVQQAIAELIAQASITQEPILPEALSELGVQPQDFADILGLNAEQREWADLLNIQYRHLDPRGMWHAIVFFDNPDGEEDLQLHLIYREAEAYGLTIGLSPDEEWRGISAPTCPLPLQQLARVGLRPESFPNHLKAVGGLR